MNIKYTVGITACILTLIIAITTQVTADTSTSTDSSRGEKAKGRLENIKDKLENMTEKRLGMATSASSSLLRKTAKVSDPVCAKAAIDTRDTAISTGFKTHSDTLLAAMTARTTAYKAAFDLTGRDRTKAIKTAQETFRKARLGSRKIFNTTEKTSWLTFKTAMKACGATGLEISSAEVTTSIAE